jgi:hypothetical protein
MLGKKFTSLHNFTDRLAAVFPSTVPVESDISVIKWEKNEFRSSLTDFSPEKNATLQAIQLLNEAQCSLV